MLYNLFSNLVESYPIFNVFRYLTVRTGSSMFTSMIVVFFIGNPIINYFASKKIHNPIRSDGPTDHIVKKIGTPTMGGVLILIGIFSGVLLWSDLSNPYNWFLIFIVGGLGILGAYDDYKKIKSGSSGGVSFRFKIISQVIIALIGIYILTYHVSSVELKNLYFRFFKNLAYSYNLNIPKIFLIAAARQTPTKKETKAETPKLESKPAQENTQKKQEQPEEKTEQKK